MHVWEPSPAAVSLTPVATLSCAGCSPSVLKYQALHLKLLPQAVAQLMVIDSAGRRASCSKELQAMLTPCCTFIL